MPLRRVAVWSTAVVTKAACRHPRSITITDILQRCPRDHRFHPDSPRMRQSACLRDRCRRCPVNLQRRPSRKDPSCRPHNDLHSQWASIIRLPSNRLRYPLADPHRDQMPQRRRLYRGPRDPTWMQFWHPNRSLVRPHSVFSAVTSLGQTVMLQSFHASSCHPQTLATSLPCFVTHSHRPRIKRGLFLHGSITMSITTPRTSSRGR